MCSLLRGMNAALLDPLPLLMRNAPGTTTFRFVQELHEGRFSTTSPPADPVDSSGGVSPLHEVGPGNRAIFRAFVDCPLFLSFHFQSRI